MNRKERGATRVGVALAVCSIASLLAGVSGAAPAPASSGVGTIVDSPVHAPTPQARNVVELSDGRLAYFHYWQDAGAIVARLSHDSGATWSDPGEHVVAEAEDSTPAVTAIDGDTAYVAYQNRASNLAVRRVTFPATTGSGSASTSSSSGSLVDPERVVYVGPVLDGPSRVTIAQNGSSVLGDRLILGFARDLGVAPAHRYEFAVSQSDNSGVTWTLPAACEADAFRVVVGSIVTQVSRPYCLSQIASSTAINEREIFTGGIPGPPRSVPVPASLTERPASSVLDEHGVLHLAFEAGSPRTTYYARRSSAGDWSMPAVVGPGEAPVLSWSSQRLQLFTTEREGAHPRLMQPYSSTDGIDWVRGRPAGTSPFSRVLDFNESWAFTGTSGDLLFSVSDAAGAMGNRVGSARVTHRLDAASKRLAFRFVPDATTSLTAVDLWMASSGSAAPSYRVGVQGEGPTGDPSGVWLNQVTEPLTGTALTGSFGTVGGGANGRQRVSLTLPAELTNGTPHFVVVEPAPATPTSPAPSPTSWLEFEATTVDPELDTNLRVLTSAGSYWTHQPDQIPRIALVAGSATALAQTLQASEPIAVTTHSAPAQLFTPDRNYVDPTLRLNIIKTGDRVTVPRVRVLTSDGSELWNDTLTEPRQGWSQMRLSGVTLLSGVTYRVMVDDRTSEVNDYWYVARSGDAVDSWGGAAANAAVAVDKPGFNDRTAEALELEGSANDLRAFNSGPTDALYVAADTPFAAVALQFDAPGAPAPSAWQYWNGGAWSSLSDATSSDGVTQFTPPTDWVASTVEGHSGFWIRTSGAATSIVRVAPPGDAVFPVVPANPEVPWTPVIAGSSQGAFSFLHLPMQDVGSLWHTRNFVMGRSAPIDDSGIIRRPSIGPVESGWYPITSAAISGSLSVDPGDGFKVTPYAEELLVVPTSIDDDARAFHIGDGLYYTNVAASTDLVVRPRLRSIRTYHVLWDATAPESFAWNMSAAAGPVTADSADDPTSLWIGEDVVAGLTDLWAYDADGRDVPLQLSFANGVLQVSATHRSAEYRYPIVLDPGWERQTKDYVKEGTATIDRVSFRVRGYRMVDCMRGGWVCVSASGDVVKVEATAQSHALRRMIVKNPQNHGPGFAIVPTDLDWESGRRDSQPQEDPAGFPDPDPCYETQSYRVDILNQNNTAGFNHRYRLIEVKNAELAHTVGEQIGCYWQRLEDAGLRAEFDDQLVNESWAAQFYVPQTDTNYVVWAWGVGAVLFAPEEDAPEPMRTRATDPSSKYVFTQEEIDQALVVFAGIVVSCVVTQPANCMAQ